MTRYHFNNDSWIKFVEYDDETKEMTIHSQFKTYTCINVPKEVYDAFEESPSKGQFFNFQVKNKYVDKLFKP